MKTNFATMIGCLTLLCSSSGLATSAFAGPPQKSNVYAPFDCTVGVDCDVVGASQLVRAKRSVSMNIWTTGLDPGSAYTVWWIIFNNPEHCGDAGCSGNDLDTPEVKGAVTWATGHIIGSTGTGNFAASLKEGPPKGDTPFGLSGDADGLIDATKAEIHLVVRTHGEAIPGLVYEQISTFDGGCDVNFCDDQQFAIHP